MRKIIRNLPAVTALGLALLGLSLFSSFVRADAFIGALATGTPFAYLPLFLKNSGPVTPPPPGNWLAYVNYQRALARLPALAENPTWSDGDYKHSIYMVKNNDVGHSEDSTKPYYTLEGLQAAQNSNVMVSSSTATTDEQAIDTWMRGPFHAVGILDPALLQTGFGSYREADGGWQMGAALDVIRGLGAIPAGVSFPVMWPADGLTVNLRTYNGAESPDPLTSCPGYGVPAGLPIILQIGDGSQTPVVTAFSFKQASTMLPSCEFDETNYAHPDGSQQSLGQAVLDARDAVVLIPKDALTPGATYTASITVNGQTYTWSFTVSLSASSLEGLDLGPEIVVR